MPAIITSLAPGSTCCISEAAESSRSSSRTWEWVAAGLFRKSDGCGRCCWALVGVGSGARSFTSCDLFMLRSAFCGPSTQCLYSVCKVACNRYSSLGCGTLTSCTSITSTSKFPRDVPKHPKHLTQRTRKHDTISRQLPRPSSLQAFKPSRSASNQILKPRQRKNQLRTLGCWKAASAASCDFNAQGWGGGGGGVVQWTCKRV